MNKTNVKIKGTVTRQASVTKSNTVISQFVDANKKVWDIVAFNRSPDVQRTLTNVDVVGKTYWFEGTIGKNPFTGKPEIVVNVISVNADMMDEIVAAITSAGGTIDANETSDVYERPEGFHPTKGLANREQGIGYYGEPLTDSHLHDVIERHKLEDVPPYF